MYDSDVPSFWQLGNSFDTMIDFLDTIDSSSANDIAQLAVKKFHDKVNPIDSFWFDDFGWWSIAAERALQKPFFQPNADQLLLYPQSVLALASQTERAFCVGAPREQYLR